MSKYFNQKSKTMIYEFIPSNEELSVSTVSQQHPCGTHASLLLQKQISEIKASFHLLEFLLLHCVGLDFIFVTGFHCVSPGLAQNFHFPALASPVLGLQVLIHHTMLCLASLDCFNKVIQKDIPVFQVECWNNFTTWHLAPHCHYLQSAVFPRYSSSFQVSKQKTAHKV